MAGVVLASKLPAVQMSPPAAVLFSTPRSPPSPAAARMSGRLWLPPAGDATLTPCRGTARRWSNDIFGIFSIKGVHTRAIAGALCRRLLAVCAPEKVG